MISSVLVEEESYEHSGIVRPYPRVSPVTCPTVSHPHSDWRSALAVTQRDSLTIPEQPLSLS